MDFTGHIPLSKKLHSPHTTILIIHEDCGAGAKIEDFERAKKIASSHVETVRCFYLNLNGTWKEIL